MSTARFVQAAAAMLFQAAFLHGHAVAEPPHELVTPAAATAAPHSQLRPSRPAAQPERGLDDPIPPIRLHRTTLARALSMLLVERGLAVHADWRSLNRDGVYSDTPIEVQLPAGTVRSALKAILASASRPMRPVAFAQSGCLIEIAPQRIFDARMEVHVYDLAAWPATALTRREEEAVRRGVSDLWRRWFHTFVPSRHRYGHVYGRDEHGRLPAKTLVGRELDEHEILEALRRRLRAGTLEELADAMRGTIDPASWEDRGGAGSIRIVGRSLVVRQSARAHGQIRELLAGLKARSPAR